VKKRIMDIQAPPPGHIVDVILKTATSRKSTVIRLLSEQDGMSVQFLTEQVWQEDMKIPTPLDGLVVAEMWARTRPSENTGLSLQISLSKPNG